MAECVAQRCYLPVSWVPIHAYCIVCIHICCVTYSVYIYLYGRDVRCGESDGVATPRSGHTVALVYICINDIYSI